MGRSRDAGGTIRAALTALLLFLASCGGGGPSVSGSITPAPKLRTDLLFGYYGADALTALETADHANLFMTRPWGPWGGAWVIEAIQQIQQTDAAVMLGIPGGYDATESELMTSWRLIQEAGLAARVVAIYPFDEPDVHGKSDAEVMERNAIFRRVFGRPLAVIYGCDTGRVPGIASYDWIGCDSYGAGCDVATGMRFAVLKSRLRPDQRILLVPGGANPWRQDPACFASKAHSDPQVVAIIAFLWLPYDGGEGVRTNGMRKLYCETGRAIRGNAVPC